MHIPYMCGSYHKFAQKGFGPDTEQEEEEGRPVLLLQWTFLSSSFPSRVFPREKDGEYWSTCFQMLQDR